MKVLQINKFSSTKGGTESVLFDTIDLLHNAGHDVVLFTTDEGDIIYNPTYTIQYPKRNDSFIYKIKNLPAFFYNKNAAGELEDILQKEKPDIAHIHLYLNSFSSTILTVLKRYQIPIVMTLHEYRQICPSYLLLGKNGNICEKCIKGNYSHCLTTRCSKGSFFDSLMLTAEMYYRRFLYKTEDYVDKFICVSDFVYTKYKQFNTNISNKSVVIRNPVARYKECEPRMGNYVLYIGRLSREKGIKTLLKAMKGLPNVHLKIVGEGIIDQSDIGINVEILGFKKKTELGQLICNASYVIVPSEWYETFGLSCAESLAYGKPVIASRIGALPELVIHGVNGFLFEAKNEKALQQTITNALSLSEEEYTAMSERAYESVENSSPQQYISHLLELYNSLLTDRS